MARFSGTSLFAIFGGPGNDRVLTVVSAPIEGRGRALPPLHGVAGMGKGVDVDPEQERDHEEERANAADVKAENEAEQLGPDDGMSIAIRKWNPDRMVFDDYEEWAVAEPWAERSQAEWFGIVTTHVPRDLPVGIYAFRLFGVNKLVAAGEFAWDGRVATRREGATAP